MSAGCFYLRRTSSVVVCLSGCVSPVCVSIIVFQWYLESDSLPQRWGVDLNKRGLGFNSEMMVPVVGANSLQVSIQFLLIYMVKVGLPCESCACNVDDFVHTMG